MTLSQSYSYHDNSYDEITISPVEHSPDSVAYIPPIEDGVYIKAADSVPLALNILGYDRPEDERVSTGRFIIGEADVFIADSEAVRDRQVRTAAALLTAVDAYDKRKARLATAEKRREAAAISLSKAVAGINAGQTFGNAEIGKLREALGRYDAELAS